MYDFEVDVVNMKLTTEFIVDGMRWNCDSSPMLQRSCVLNMLPGSMLTLAFTFCQGRMSKHASLSTLKF